MSQTTTTMRPHLPLKRPAGLATHPSVLLNLYVYGYLNRVQSSRRLEREVVSRIFRTFFQATAPWVDVFSSNSGFMSMYFRVAHLPAAICLKRAAARLRQD